VYAKKEYERVEMQLHSFLMSALDAGDGSLSSLPTLFLGKDLHCPLNRGLAWARATLDVLE
jgi:hypothetical protein